MEQQGRRCGTEQEARGRLSAWRLFRLYWIELIKLNVLFLLLCLPVVTIPAAIAAMNRIVLDMLYRKPFDYRMWRGMMTTFRRDFWRSTAAGIVLGAALAVCGYGAYSVGWRGEQTNVIAAAACLVMAFTSFNLGMHVFMQLAYLELSLAQAFKMRRFAYMRTETQPCLRCSADSVRAGDGGEFPVPCTAAADLFLLLSLFCALLHPATGIGSLPPNG